MKICCCDSKWNVCQEVMPLKNKIQNPNFEFWKILHFLDIFKKKLENLKIFPKKIFDSAKCNQIREMDSFLKKNYLPSFVKFSES